MRDRAPPKIENAPGVTFKPRKNGWEARWHARTDLIARGYPYKKSQAIMLVGFEPTDTDRAWISDQCQRLQAEMLIWGRGDIPVVGGFDGSLKTLIACYQHDADSSYRKLRYRTREHYDGLLRRMERDHGDEQMAEVKARTLLRWHEEWSIGGKIAMAHAMVGTLRTLCGFGATILEDAECERLCGVMHKMRFKMAKPRVERLTAEQAIAVRAMAHQMGRPSIAMAQAFQFELMLRQKDVIGEWVPQSEKEFSDVLNGNEKWLRGIRWSEIDVKLILRHTTSKRNKDIEVDLKLAPMILEELALLPYLPGSGPVIVCAYTGVPWTNSEFRRWWRKVADACHIPKTVKNMDSRAGGISEATDAGAELEHVRHAATHGDIAMTQRYSRGSIEKVANVMNLRSAHRNKK